MSFKYRSNNDNNNNKKATKKWKEPQNKTQWMLDLIDAGESAVKGYEKYLLNEIDYAELAKVMLMLRELLPMNIDKRYCDDDDEEE